MNVAKQNFQCGDEFRTSELLVWPLVRMEMQGPDPSGERRNLGLNLKKSVYWVEVLHDF